MNEFIEAEIEIVRFTKEDDIITTSAPNAFEGEWDTDDENTLNGAFNE